MKGIDVEELEDELARLWSEESAGRREGAHASVTRACALNLVAYAASPRERAALEDVLAEVTERHPCRSFVLLADRAAEVERLEAYVSMRCQLTKRGGKQVCGEQVTIEAAGRAAERVASAVAPLLVPDVPVFLWWPDIPHNEDRLFARLAELSDRIVIDSAASDRPHADLLRLARSLEHASARAHVSDINWGRLTSWRALVASFWDVPSYRPHLERLGRAVVAYGRPRVAPEEVAAQGWLVAGWLASRLGWRVAGARGVREGAALKFAAKGADGRAVEIELRATDAGPACEGQLSSVTLEDVEGGAQFFVEYRPERTKLETGARHGGGSSVGRVLAYEARSEGRRLSAELDFLTPDAVYESAVKAAARLLESLPPPASPAPPGRASS